MHYFVRTSTSRADWLCRLVSLLDWLGMPGSPRSSSNANLATATVLVVDDEEDMRLMIRMFLERAGFDVVEEAVDGPEALDAYERLNPPPVPTVIVLDNRMPSLSGIEVAREVLRRMPDQRIVLFSAHLTPEVEREAAGLGVNACVAKTEVHRLAEVVSGLLES